MYTFSAGLNGSRPSEDECGLAVCFAFLHSWGGCWGNVDGLLLTVFALPTSKTLPKHLAAPRMMGMWGRRREVYG